MPSGSRTPPLKNIHIISFHIMTRTGCKVFAFGLCPFFRCCAFRFTHNALVSGAKLKQESTSTVYEVTKRSRQNARTPKDQDRRTLFKLIRFCPPVSLNSHLKQPSSRACNMSMKYTMHVCTFFRHGKGRQRLKSKL